MLQHRLLISQIHLFIRFLAFLSPILIIRLLPLILNLRCDSLLFLLGDAVFQLVDYFLESGCQLYAGEILKVFQTGDLISEDSSCKVRVFDHVVQQERTNKVVIQVDGGRGRSKALVLAQDLG